jgi:signal transduction histidine kinase
MTDLDLEKLTLDTVKIQQDTADLKNQKIILECDGDLWIRGDEIAIRQILNNLVSNALKYSPAGKSTRIDLRRRNKHVVLSVQDQGPGLDENDQKRVFQKFQRLTPQPTGGESSTGLGLHITKQLVELHQGTIQLETEPGKGCNFIVELPVQGDTQSPNSIPPTADH